MRRLSRRTAIALGLLPTVAGGRAFAGSRGAWPQRGVRYVVPYAPGGPTDRVGRLVARELSARWGLPVEVDNQPGSNANVGAELVARASADGYTLLQGTSSTHGSNVALFHKLGYDPRADFLPIVGLIETPLYLSVLPDAPFTTVKELIAQARSAPLRYGTAGPGSPQHLAGELLRLRTRIALVPVHYRGGAPAMAALDRGEIDFYFSSAGAKQQRDGRVRVLGVTSDARWPLAPEVPTLAEGGLPDFELLGWFALFAPRGTPAAVIARVNADVNAALAEPALHRMLQAMGYRVLGGTPQDLGARIEREAARWAELVRATGLRLD